MTPQERYAHFRVGLSALYLPKYDALCAKLAAWDLGTEFPAFAGHVFAPYDGFRSFQEQDADYLKGRQGRPGSVITNARGGESPHQYGCANDWTPTDATGNVVWPMKGHPVWVRFAEIVEGVGLKSGIHFKDPDHSELAISCDWKHVLIAFKQNGMTAAQEHIKANLV